MTHALLASPTTDWIGALSTLGLGVIGLAVTAWQWWASGFRPKVSAWIDPQHQGIQVQIVNRGRGNGVINRVAVVDVDQVAVENLAFKGFAGNRFTAHPLPGSTAMTLIIEPAGDNPMPFSCKDRVKVVWGGTSATVDLERAQAAIYGLPSVLPPTAG